MSDGACCHYCRRARCVCGQPEEEMMATDAAHHAEVLNNVIALQTALAALRDENERLREALRPFAEYDVAGQPGADRIGWRDDLIGTGAGAAGPTLGDCRRAAAALAGAGIPKEKP